MDSASEMLSFFCKFQNKQALSNMQLLFIQVFEPGIARLITLTEHRFWVKRAATMNNEYTALL